MRRGLTEEELALLGHSDLVAEEGQEPELIEDRGSPMPAGFHERLVLGDLSW
jgi:hypothetical protein